MTATPDPLTATDLIAGVRFLIADLDENHQLITDTQISQALRAEGGVDLLAAARCLETIAISEVLVAKKIRTQDLTTDGPAVSAELRAQAARLRDRYQAEADAAELFDGFDLAPTVPSGRRPEHTARPVPEVWGL